MACLWPVVVNFESFYDWVILYKKGKLIVTGTLNEEMLAATLRPGTALTGGIKGTALEKLNAHLNIFDMFTDESEKNIVRHNHVIP